MMSAALLSGMARADFALSPVLISLVVGVATIIGASLLHKRIDQEEWAQLLASLALALLVIPPQLYAQLPLSHIATHVVAWGSVFIACSFAVRACFARASKRKRKRALLLQLASIAIPWVATLGLALGSQRSATFIALIGATGVTGIGFWRPMPKRLIATGVTMTVIIATALLAQLVLEN